MLVTQAGVRPLLKRLAAHLPAGTQHELRRIFFRSQIRRRSFFTDEKEYALLDRLLRAGDWALDIGANVGHYTLRMAELAGPTGRVIALEPIPDTFALLTENVRHSGHANVSLLNCAASERTAIVGMEIPRFPDGLENYYQAHVVSGAAGLTILALSIDSLALPAVRLVKIDAEGHELPVLQGMRQLVQRDHPVLIVETSTGETTRLLESWGYRVERLPGSSNVLCQSADRLDLG
ncbi:MAG TPA: FkbM family methyltransferase [Burkholderiales bacterium]|nr:FkbM family methyltransferase [Burkholderiales bacterium]